MNVGDVVAACAVIDLARGCPVSPELRAAVVDVGATFKRCLALARLYHPGHETVRELSMAAGQKLKAALVLSASASEPATTLAFSVEARSVSCGGKPILVDEGTENAVSALYIDGVASLVFDAAVNDDAVAALMRLWGQAADRRTVLPDDQTFSTLLWEAQLPGITVIAQADDVPATRGDAGAEAEKQEALARRQGLVLRLMATPALPPSAGSLAATAALPVIDTDNVLVALLQGTLQALPTTKAEERPVLLRLVAQAFARTVAARELAGAGDALMATVQSAREWASTRPTISQDLEALCSTLADDEVKAALIAVAGGSDGSGEGGVDGAELMKLLRFLPRRLIAVLLSLCRFPKAKEALTARLTSLNIAEGEWATFAQAAGPAGVDVVFAVARGKGPAAAAAVVAAFSDGHSFDAATADRLFVEFARLLRGLEVEAARPLLQSAMGRPACAAVAEDLLVRLKDPLVTPRLVARLNDEARPVEQRKSAAVALMRFEGDAAKAALRAAFTTVKSDELKGAIGSVAVAVLVLVCALRAGRTKKEAVALAFIAGLALPHQTLDDVAAAAALSTAQAPILCALRLGLWQTRQQPAHGFAGLVAAAEIAAVGLVSGKSWGAAAMLLEQQAARFDAKDGAAIVALCR